MNTNELQNIKKRYNIVGNCPELNRALDIALQVAPTDLSVLVVGESGVGKEIIPRLIHDNSPRRREKYFAINCGSIPEGTIDSELFGHEKGSFTGAIGESEGYFGIANKGTIFLDEVGELPLATQARLLRVLETGEYLRVGGTEIRKTNVRIVAATNVNMRKAVSEGRFREDLFYRLNTIPIKMPALRDRGEDIALLFRLFAMQMAEKYNIPKISLRDDARALLMKYKWPGNVRQLKNITEQMSILSPEREITAEALKQFVPDDVDSTELATTTHGGSHTYESERSMLFKVLYELRNTVDDLKSDVNKLRSQLNEGGSSHVTAISTIDQLPDSVTTDISLSKHVLPQTSYAEAVEINEAEAENNKEPESLNLDDIGRQALEKALEKHGGNREKASRELGISVRTLYRRLKQYGLD